MRKQLDLTNPDTLRAVARRAGVSANRRLSQNFLVDRIVVKATADALQLTGDDTVVEIGPGMGTLTSALASRARRVIAVEIDPACVRACGITLRDLDNVTVVEGDARTIDLDAFNISGRWFAAGNLPYHMTGALLASLLERDRPPQRGVFMVQREVAHRLAAASGDWSLATVAVRSLADVEIVRDVPPESFDPAPKVHSSVMRLTPLTRQFSSGERTAMIELAKSVFQMRRKTLRHGLAHWTGDGGVAREILGEAGIDPSRRPGTLDLSEWRTLAALAMRIRSADGS